MDGATSSYSTLLVMSVEHATLPKMGVEYGRCRGYRSCVVASSITAGVEGRDHTDLSCRTAYPFLTLYDMSWGASSGHIQNRRTGATSIWTSGSRVNVAHKIIPVRNIFHISQVLNLCFVSIHQKCFVCWFLVCYS